MTVEVKGKLDEEEAFPPQKESQSAILKRAASNQWWYFQSPASHSRTSPSLHHFQIPIALTPDSGLFVSF